MLCLTLNIMNKIDTSNISPCTCSIRSLRVRLFLEILEQLSVRTATMHGMCQSRLSNLHATEFRKRGPEPYTTRLSTADPVTELHGLTVQLDCLMFFCSHLFRGRLCFRIVMVAALSVVVAWPTASPNRLTP